MGTLRFYRDEPLFGLDIGHASLKAMQIDIKPRQAPTVIGYGNSPFPPDSILNGVIVKPEVIAVALHELLDKRLVGAISSRRVACALPTAHTFSRPMKLPPMEHEEIVEAIHLEAEQYIPIPIGSLYLDYEITSEGKEGAEILLVAAPRKIVDSYVALLESLKLEPVAFEPSINAPSRLLTMEASSKDQPAVIIDVGSVTTDIAIFDESIIVSSTVSSGSDTMADLISKSLHISVEHASQLKNEIGIAYSEHQQRIIDAIKPELETVVHEIQKTVRYYSERAAGSGHKLAQIITVGGGAIMPGLNQYLHRELQLPTHNLDPWQQISFGRLPIPSAADSSMYITVAGQAILNPTEIVK
ncbi:MAG TPA: type IV pilus assembly protein PilM [Candidatus Saccharimonadales bacterium]|nr:type IV pilus assembly protein PilM [Candidatus Saccharimonadales bacterium]